MANGKVRSQHGSNKPSSKTIAALRHQYRYVTALEARTGLPDSIVKLCPAPKSRFSGLIADC
jgi:hypothetical protein